MFAHATRTFGVARRAWTARAIEDALAITRKLLDAPRRIGRVAFERERRRARDAAAGATGPAAAEVTPGPAPTVGA